LSSCIVDGDELRYAFQDGLVGLGFGAEDEIDADGVTTMSGAGKQVVVTCESDHYV
jgi:hypothetical protein